MRYFFDVSALAPSVTDCPAGASHLLRATCWRSVMRAHRFEIDHQGSRNGLQPIAGGSLRTVCGKGQALAELPAALVHLHFDERNALVLTVCLRFSDADTAGICECEPELVRRRRLSGIARIVELYEGPS